jgi:soluble lytic murein transglycosylase-like protein
MNNASVILLSLLGFGLYIQRRQVRKPGRWTLPAAGYKYKNDLDRATLIYQLPKNLLARVAAQESDFRPNVISNRGAVGLMQIVPRFHRSVDPTIPKDSIFYAAEYLRNLYNRFGSWKLALAAYNWGPTNLQKKGIANAPRETKNYVAQISHDINLV